MGKVSTRVEGEAHDFVTRLACQVMDGKIEVEWEYEYHEDTDEIPTDEEQKKYGDKYNPPEYFFTIKLDRTEFGRDQESGLLKFKDWVEIVLKDRAGQPMADENYSVEFADGTTRDGSLDSDGCARIEDVPPGRYRVTFPDTPGTQRSEGR